MTLLSSKLISSTLETLSDAQHFLLIALFYAVTVLQLPMDTVIKMFALLVLFAFGLNMILDTEE